MRIAYSTVLAPDGSLVVSRVQVERPRPTVSPWVKRADEKRLPVRVEYPRPGR